MIWFSAKYGICMGHHMRHHTYMSWYIYISLYIYWNKVTSQLQNISGMDLTVCDERRERKEGSIHVHVICMLPHHDHDLHDISSIWHELGNMEYEESARHGGTHDILPHACACASDTCIRTCDSCSRPNQWYMMIMMMTRPCMAGVHLHQFWRRIKTNVYIKCVCQLLTHVLYTRQVLRTSRFQCTWARGVPHFACRQRRD